MTSPDLPTSFQVCAGLSSVSLSVCLSVSASFFISHARLRDLHVAMLHTGADRFVVARIYSAHTDGVPINITNHIRAPLTPTRGSDFYSRSFLCLSISKVPDILIVNIQVASGWIWTTQINPVTSNHRINN